MIVLLTLVDGVVLEDRNMAKQKHPGVNKAGIRSKEKDLTVADGSLQARAPGWVAPGGASPQFDINRAARDRTQSMQQGGFGGSQQGERGGLNQQSGWSSRQQAERMRARAEESRQGMSQRSGYGAEQNQHAGSRESATGPAGSLQSASQGSPQRQGPSAPASDYVSKKTDTGSGNR
jgi:hypothetical protein